MNATLKEPPKTTKKSKEKPQKEIPHNKVMEFIGTVKDFYKVDCHLVHPLGKFRINVWTKEEKQDCVIPTFHLTDSYYVYYTPSGEIVDETIKRKLDKKSIFS